MIRVLVDIQGSEVVMAWISGDEPVQVFYRNAFIPIPETVGVAREWCNGMDKHIDEVLTGAGFSCDRCEEIVLPNLLVQDTETDAKWCKSCAAWLEEQAEIEAERSEEMQAERKGAEK